MVAMPTILRPADGLFPKSKQNTHLIVKSEFEEEAIKVFEGTGIKVTSEGHEMLGSAIGSHDFVKTFTAEKIDVFVNEIEDFAKIAEHYPQSAYAAFSHCIVSKWRYLMRTVEDIDSLFEPLEDSINQVFIPALTGRSHCNANERSFISLPIRYGGLNIINPITNASHEYQSSQKISAPLKGMIVKQRESFSKPQLQSIKASLRQEKKERMKDMSQQEIGKSLIDNTSFSAAPPVVEKTSGVKELFSTSLTCSPYSLFLSNSCFRNRAATLVLR
ncbi:Hypothetical predicted protein [Paramuricea clavata]|uniref:Uncharacterized protein n=1 Tax=Paramuricea clavata TaxID=317549 RepID=A0A7D9DEV8_PARCT|nr:Hypothetical predicted protein [Paramuricea clavata]